MSAIHDWCIGCLGQNGLGLCSLGFFATKPDLGFRDIKSSMQHNTITLRSKTVELVYQELWGLVLTYNIIRCEAAIAAVAFERSPCDIRFKAVCHI